MHSAISDAFFKPLTGAAKVQGAMPATHGRYYMDEHSLYLLGDSRPLLTVPSEDPRPRPPGPGSQLRLAAMLGQPRLEVLGYPFNVPLHLDKRGYFIPDAKLLIHIPVSNNQLVLRRFDVEAELEKSGTAYLFVVSEPPARAKKGARYRYPLAVKSKQGGVTYRLESAPKGMNVSDAGVLTWDVPRNFAESDVDVILTVRDKGGQEVFHTFGIRVGDQGEAQEPPAVNVAAEPIKPVENQPWPRPAAERPLLPPVRPAPVIQPPRLAADQVVTTLSSTIAGVAIGGGGRYLILHLPRESKLAVFDVSEAKIAGYVPLGGDDVKFAAGRDKLIVVLGDKNVIQRWDLATQKREASAILPARAKLSNIVMGSASDGPLLAASPEKVFFLDISTLKQLPLEITGEHDIHILQSDGVRASADGRVFAMWRSQISPQGLQTLVLQGKEAKGYYEHDTAGPLVPGADGQVIYTANGRFTNHVKPLGERDNGAPFCFPAVQGSYFLTLEGKGLNRPGSSSRPILAVHLPGDERPLTTLPRIEVPRSIQNWGRERMTADKRILFIPPANVIVILPDSNDRLVLHRFDVQQTLEKSGLDYLFVVSQPPVTARRGATYRYQLAVKAKKGDVKYRVESGPKDMKISDAGLLTWDVPRALSASPITVIVAIRDGGGQEIFHTFSILPDD